MFEVKRTQRIRLIINGETITDLGLVVLVKTNKGFQVSEGFSERTLADMKTAYEEGGLIEAAWNLYPDFGNYDSAEKYFNMKVEEMRTNIKPQVADNLRVEVVFPEGYVTVVPKRT